VRFRRKKHRYVGKMGEVGKGVLIFLIAVQEKILFSLYFFDYFRYSGYLNS